LESDHKLQIQELNNKLASNLNITDDLQTKINDAQRDVVDYNKNRQKGRDIIANSPHHLREKSIDEVITSRKNSTGLLNKRLESLGGELKRVSSFESFRDRFTESPNSSAPPSPQKGESPFSLSNKSVSSISSVDFFNKLHGTVDGLKEVIGGLDEDLSETIENLGKLKTVLGIEEQDLVNDYELLKEKMKGRKITDLLEEIEKLGNINSEQTNAKNKFGFNIFKGKEGKLPAPKQSLSNDSIRNGGKSQGELSEEEPKNIPQSTSSSSGRRLSAIFSGFNTGRRSSVEKSFSNSLPNEGKIPLVSPLSSPTEEYFSDHEFSEKESQEILQLRIQLNFALNEINVLNNEKVLGKEKEMIQKLIGDLGLRLGSDSSLNQVIGFIKELINPPISIAENKENETNSKERKSEYDKQQSVSKDKEENEEMSAEEIQEMIDEFGQIERKIFELEGQNNEYKKEKK